LLEEVGTVRLRTSKLTRNSYHDVAKDFAVNRNQYRVLTPRIDDDQIPGDNGRA